MDRLLVSLTAKHKDPCCAAVLQQLNKTVNLDLSSESGSKDFANNNGPDLMAQPVLFDGDAFGSAQDYADEDLGQAEPGAVDDLVDEDLEEEQATAAAAAELESGWEPH